MNSIRLDHVQIAAPPGCEAEARRWFGGVLGLRELAKPEALRGRGGAWFELGDGGGQLHVGVEAGFEPARKAHPALRVADLEALARRLEAAGSPVRWDDAIPGERRFYSTDPWGNRVEFLAAVGSAGGRDGAPERPEAFAATYLGRLREQIGTDLVLAPGAMVVLRRADGEVLLTRRADNRTWCFPAGNAEEGGSFAATAVAETAEETGVTVRTADLVPFGCLSEAELHTVHYPSGDVVHCFALLFVATAWSGEPHPDGEETTAVRWASAAALPEPMHEPSRVALGLLARWDDGGGFQVA